LPDGALVVLKPNQLCLVKQFPWFYHKL